MPVALCDLRSVCTVDFININTVICDKVWTTPEHERNLSLFRHRTSRLQQTPEGKCVKTRIAGFGDAGQTMVPPALTRGRIVHFILPPQHRQVWFYQMDVLAVPGDRQKGWYLSLMAPNTKGPTFAWLDPSRLYCNSQALADCVADLLSPFHTDTIDLVAGIDAMGFILGASIATTLGKGFLAIRKAGHLCVATQNQGYSDYTGKEKMMEIRLDVLKPGVRVLLVDQWIETGGTMKAAIQLVERLGATVVGIAAVAVENTEGGKWIKENYKFSHCIPEELQSQVDQKCLDSFKCFDI